MKTQSVEILEHTLHQKEPADERSERTIDLQAARTLVIQTAAVQRLLRIYRPNNAAVIQAADSLMESLGAFFTEMSDLEIRFWRDCIFVCGDRLRCDVSIFTAYKSLLGQSVRLEIEKVELTAGITREEMVDFLKLLDALDTEHVKGDAVVERILSDGFKHVAVVPSVRSQELEDLGLQALDSQERAKRAFYAALGSAKETLITQSSQGVVNLRKAKRAVQAAADAMLEDETSVLALATIKDHDEYTFTHSVNVCVFSLAIGHRLGLHRNWLGRLGMAALLHDIGKTSVPTGVLNKIGVLDVDEWKAIREHTLMGVKGLCKLPKTSEHMIHAMIVAFQHHINLDLSGYPDVPEDTSLDLFSRIVRIADTFDAMTTERPYRNKVYSPHEAMRYLISEAGIKFDPVLVKAFAAAMGIYPIGTVLRINTNAIGIVVRRSELSGEPDRALIRVILDHTGNQISDEVFLDLGEVDPDTGEFIYQVTETLSCRDLGVNPRDYLLGGTAVDAG
jgi:HD-GYP domain-containing protein (c-di-GMP phosphodiesterase class II)